jgi:hypothetical protein
MQPKRQFLWRDDGQKTPQRVKHGLSIVAMVREEPIGVNGLRLDKKRLDPPVSALLFHLAETP